MSLRSTCETFDAWRTTGKPLALVTVVRTDGSTYSKAGHRILIAGNGDYHGLVSGGCLEGDLAEHALTVIETGKPVALEYDLRDDADEPWGMGIGCNGVIDVLMQRLDAQTDYEPFATLARTARAGRDMGCTIVTASKRADVLPGATIIGCAGTTFSWQTPGPLADATAAAREAARATRQPAIETLDGLTLLHAPARGIPRLLVAGAGPDAIPLVRMAVELGWHVTVADHREAYIAQPAFESADTRIHTAPGTLPSTGNSDSFTATIVMSHHLESDRAWLAALAKTRIPYIGLLGPPARRERLVAGSDTQSALAGRLHGPVGLDIGADTPETIALSILAGLQLHLATGSSS